MNTKTGKFCFYLIEFFYIQSGSLRYTVKFSVLNLHTCDPFWTLYSVKVQFTLDIYCVQQGMHEACEMETGQSKLLSPQI